MKFCPECNNCLYHREHDEKLILKCNNCGFKEDFKKNVIETKLYKSDVLFSMETNNYTVNDITLPRTIHRKCPNEKCKSKTDPKLQEAVFITDKNTLELLYICCVCNTEWKYS